MEKIAFSKVSSLLNLLYEMMISQYMYIEKREIIIYGVATISTLLKITGLFRRILSLLQGSFAKETYNFW